MRFHSPPTFFVGYLRRRSPWACSRTLAPLAQCAPRLKGLSNDGDWPTQTPSYTSAVTVHPTEQCVQTDKTFLISPAAPIFPAACAFRTRVRGNVVVNAAVPHATNPDCLKNVRRSRNFTELAFDFVNRSFGRDASRFTSIVSVSSRTELAYTPVGHELFLYTD